MFGQVSVFYDLIRVICESKHRNVCLEIFVFVWFSNKTCGIKEKVCLLGQTYCFEVRLLLPNYFTILKFRHTSVPFSSAPASLMSNFQSQSCHIRASPRWFISQLTGVHVEVVLSDLCVRFFLSPWIFYFYYYYHTWIITWLVTKFQAHKNFLQLDHCQSQFFCVSPSCLKS